MAGTVCRGVVPVVERHAGRGQVGLDVLGDVGPAGAFLVTDDVGRVVGDDVEVDLHAAGVGGVDEGLRSSLVPRWGSIWVKSVIQ